MLLQTALCVQLRYGRDASEKFRLVVNRGSFMQPETQTRREEEEEGGGWRVEEEGGGGCVHGEE